MNASLTPAEQRVYGRIRQDLATRGRAPSYAELAETGVSKGNAHRVVSQLVRKGLLRRAPGRGRGLRLVPGADSYTVHLEATAGAQLQALAAARNEVPEVIIARALADYLGRAA